jgi:hypothetical protein
LLLVSQVAFAAALCGTFLVPAVWNLLWDSPPAAWAAAADGALGWSAVVLAAAAAGMLSWRRGASDNHVGFLVAAVVALVALTVARTDTGNWEAYHTLLLGNCVAACALPFVARGTNGFIGGKLAAVTPLNWTSGAGRFFQAATVFLAFWGFDGDPSGVGWAVAALVAMGALCVWIAWREARRRRMWFAAMLLVPAASMAWLDWGNATSPTTSIPGQICEFLWANVWAVAAVALLSVWIERRRIQQVASEPRWRGIGFHRCGVWAMVVTLVLTTLAGVFADYAGESFDVSEPLAWLTWVAVAVTGLACVWDPAMRFPVACLYCIGLVAVGMYLNSLDLRPPMFYWALANALAAYSLATSALWSVREKIGATLERVGVAVGESAKPQAAVGSAGRQGGGHGWLVLANLLVGVFVLLLVAIVELSIESFVQRMVAAYAVGAQAFAIGLLARGRVRTALQYTALVWGVLFAVAFSWAFLPTDFESPWLHRLVLTVVALTLAVVVYGFVLVKFLKRENEWTLAAMRLVPTLAVLTVGLVLAVVGVEVFTYMDRGVVNVAAPARLAIGVALVGLIIAALAAALLPGRDPMGLSERGRTVYVYTAEGLAALLFVHIRVTMPWLFHGWFLRFWPLIVMVIAFVGVGLGEVFQRRQNRVLSEPLNNTGVLLPLLPVIGFWFVESRVNYSLLLLSIGVLYASLSVLRKSMLYGALAALAANGSLWYLLHDREGLGFLDHPQLWLIPPALSALIAAYINRERLTKEQSAALRYVSAIVIYVSSTVDIFINGVAEAPWLPAVLAGLSILGVLAGIMLRVRAFLYLGLAFLVVALLTIIWHAGNQYTWIWWVAGIVTGALIIAAFGLIEKRRDDVRRALEELRHWQA